MTSRSSEVVIYLCVCLHRLYTKCARIFPIEEISAQEYTPRWQPQVIHRMFCKRFTDHHRGSTTFSSRKGWKCLPRRIFCMQASFIFLSQFKTYLSKFVRKFTRSSVVAIKLRERKEMGLDELHDDIDKAPLCEERSIITKILFCCKCNNCGIYGLCYECYKNGVKHYLTYPIYDENDYNEIFQKFYWAAAI